MLNINLAMIQYWATWRTPCIIFTPSNMFLTWTSWKKSEGPRQCPENGTDEKANGRQENIFWNLDTIQEAARNECLLGSHRPQNRGFQRVECRLQLSEDSLDVTLGWTELLVPSLPIKICPETWTSRYNESQGRLECLQSQTPLPAACNHHSASHSLIQNQRAQYPSPRTVSGEQRSHMQSIIFLCWLGGIPELPGICKAWIHGTPKPQ